MRGIGEIEGPIEHFLLRVGVRMSLFDQSINIFAALDVQQHG